MQQKLDLDGLERKHDAAPVGTINHACIEQGRDIGMNRLHITFDASGGFANRDRSGDAKRFSEGLCCTGFHWSQAISTFQ